MLVLLADVDTFAVQVRGEVQFLHTQSALFIVKQGLLKVIKVFRNIVDGAAYLKESSLRLNNIDTSVLRLKIFESIDLPGYLCKNRFAFISEIVNQSHKVTQLF